LVFFFILDVCISVLGALLLAAGDGLGCDEVDIGAVIALLVNCQGK
jgi:hypothetical protein